MPFYLIYYHRLYFYFNKGGPVFKRYGTIKYVHRILFCHERVYIQIDVREVTNYVSSFSTSVSFTDRGG